MKQTEKFKDTVPEPTPQQREEGQRNLEHVAKERSDTTGKSTEDSIEELLEEISRRRWEVEFSAIPEGPFYRPERLGEQKRLVINTAHPFYAKVYDVAPEVKAALEVLLFVLAERELESRGEAEIFYKSERQKWSERLRHALDNLIPDESLVNRSAAVSAQLHATVATE